MAPPTDIVMTLSTRERSGRSVVLSGSRGRYVFGRALGPDDGAVDIVLPDRFASRRHFDLAWSAVAETWVLKDLGSANGTLVEESLVDRPIELGERARVRVGATIVDLWFCPPATDTPAALQPFAEAGRHAEPVLPYDPTDPPHRVAPLGEPSASLDPSTLVPTTRRLPRPPAPYDLPADDSADGTPEEGELGNTGVPSTLSPPLNVVRFGEAAERARAAQGLDGDPIDPTMDEARVDPSSAGSFMIGHSMFAGAAAPAALVPRMPAIAEPEVEAVPAARVVPLRGLALDLVQANLLSPTKAQMLAATARATGRSFFRALAEDPAVPLRDMIFRRVAANLRLDLIETEADLQDQAVKTDWLPFALAEAKGAVVIRAGDPRAVVYATIDPFDVMLDDWVRRCVGDPSLTVSRVMVLPSAFEAALQRLKNRLSDDDAGEVGIAIDIDIEHERRLERQVHDIEVPQIVNYLMHRGFVQAASDIHVEPTEDVLIVRNRVDGILHDDTTLPMALHPEVTSRLKIIAGMDVAEKRRPQDGRISVVIRSTPIDVRVSTFPTVYGEKVVLRLLDQNALRPSPEALGLLPHDLGLLREKIAAPYGLIMISGPTGSGKTTTLYSCLGAIDKKAKNVLTIEDPVEYRLRGVHQMQVNERIGVSFASGLRTILRQDPDIIMIGECRDTETAAMAIQASLTGHIVFSTIHTNDAVGVVARLLDMGIDPFLVCNALTMAVAQRLVRRVCPHCRTTESGADVIARLGREGVGPDRLAKLGIEIDADMPYVTAHGCMVCRSTGYLGRQAVFELFEMTPETRAEIMSPSFNADNLRRLALMNGMTTLIGHGMRLVDDGVTTLDEIIRVLGESY